MSDQNQDPGPTVTSPAAQLYDSLPIPSGSQFIRVLDIPAKSSTANEGLTGSLRVVDLKDSPKFTALSYVWGKASGISINCNGYEVNVTDACFEALSSLREALGGLTIWVDAICINQADKDEKSAQLPLMELIYTWAEAVYIWLEPGNENVKEALEYVRSVSRHHLFSVGVPWRSERRTMTTFEEKFRFYMSAFIMSCFKDYINGDRWFPIKLPFTDWPKYECTAFLGLMDQDWLQRSWTFQEFVLASNPILVFGQDHVPLAHWYQALAWARDVHHLDRESTSGRALKKWMSLSSVWQTLPRPCSWNGNRFRMVPDRAGGFKSSCSVQGYIHTMGAGKLKLLASLSSFVLHMLAVWYLPHLIRVSEYAVAKWGPKAPHTVLKACISGICSLCAWFNFVWFFITYYGKGLRFSGDRICRRQLGDFEQSQSRDHLVGLLRAIRERECSLKEDRVFAVGAILHRLGIEPPTPNYRKSTATIYQDSFASLVERDPSFISLLIETGSPLRGAPSWVPNWSTVADRSWLSSSYMYDSIQDPTWSGKQLTVSVCGGNLSVHVAFFGPVIHCTGPFHTVEFDSAGDIKTEMQGSLLHNTQALCQWVMRIRRDKFVDTEYDSIPGGILSTLKGCHLGRGDINQDIRQVFNKVYAIMRRHCAQLEKELEDATGITPATRATLEDLAAEKPCLDFVIKMCNELVGRRGLFLGSTGLMGSASDTMLEGDLIALVEGVAAPIILRRQGDGLQGNIYSVVGPSFISGLMRFHAIRVEAMGLDWERVDLV